MKISGVKGIIWDLDGTLIDSLNLYEDVLREVVAEAGHAMPPREVLIKNYHGKLRDTFRITLGLKTEEEIDIVENLFRVKQEARYEGSTDSHFFEDAIHLTQIAAQKGIPQFIITNRVHAGSGLASPHSIVAASQLMAECIDEIKCGDEVVMNKPNVRVVEGWFEAHGIKEEDVLVIGDQEVDAQLAINIGARGILISRLGDELPHTLEHERVVIVDNLHNIELV